MEDYLKKNAYLLSSNWATQLKLITDGSHEPVHNESDTVVEVDTLIDSREPDADRQASGLY